MPIKTWAGQIREGKMPCYLIICRKRENSERESGKTEGKSLNQNDQGKGNSKEKDR